MAKAKAKRKPAAPHPDAVKDGIEFATALRGVILNLPPLPGDGEAHRQNLVAFLTKKMEA